MSYVYSLPQRNDGRSQIFYTTGTWVKPEGISMISIVCIGGGGGGAGGQTLAGSPKTGGGGGGSGGVTRSMFPAIFIPSTLNVVVGVGGAGGLTNATGTAGNITYVDLPNSGNNSAASPAISSTVICRAPAGQPGNVAGTAGPGGTVPAVTTYAAITIGIISLSAGQAGSAGNQIAGSDVTFGATAFITVSGGAGGGGFTSPTAFAGGSVIVTPTSYIPSNTGGAAGADGSNGIFLYKPFSSTGGSGGGGSSLGTGGKGGDGEIGSGGGGGGAGTTGGVGGKGGNGLVIITCW
jgi:hypothetical protein